MSKTLIYDEDFCNNQNWASGNISTLNGICQKDYKRDYFNLAHNFDCIDLDTYEKSHSAKNNKTTDCVIGVKNSSSPKSSTSSALCIELKLNMTNPAQFDSTKAEGKIQNSSNILISQNLSVQSDVYFLYPQNIVAHIKSIIFRQKHAHPILKKIIPTTVSEFENNVNINGTSSFTPKNDPKMISTSINEAYSKGENDLTKTCNYWLEMSEKESNRFNKPESSHIINTALEKLKELSNTPINKNMKFCIDYYIATFEGKQ